MSDDVMTRLRVRDYCWCADLDPCQTCWERQSAADEIERLRLLADQLARALQWYEPTGSTCNALTAWKEARRER